MDKITTSRLKPKNKKKKYKFITSILLICFLVIGSYIGFVAVKATNTFKNAEQLLGRGNKSDLRSEAVKPLTHNVSVLIMGVDESEKRSKSYGEAIRTDALLLATFNKDDKTVKLLSIPRDTYAYIPVEEKKDKITHAHAFGQVKYGKDGGPQATIEAVESLLNVPVDYFVKFNFNSFIKIIDDLGGIEVDVPIDFSEQNSKDEKDAIKLTKGVQILNGEEALALARTRHIDSDMMRGQRQQLVIEAIVKKAASVGSIGKVTKILEGIDGQFKTNLPMSDILSFYKYGINSTIEKLQLEGEDSYLYPNGPENQRVYYYVPDEENLSMISKELSDHLGLDETSSANN